MRVLAVVLFAGSVGAVVVGQGQSQQFEVVSIKPNTTNSGNSVGAAFRAGRLQSVNVTVENLIVSAYRMDFFAVDNLPGWARSERYDVSAVAPTASTAADVPAMLRQLLSDRFKLRAHSATRQVDGYELTRVRSDSLGPDLRPLTVDCRTYTPERPLTVDDLKGVRPCATSGGAGFYVSGNTTSANLARELQRNLGVPVSDQTGLTGSYIAQLRWNHDPGGPNGDPSLPSLFAAVEEQLGLKLKPRKVAVDVLIIDDIEPPTEN